MVSDRHPACAFLPDQGRTRRATLSVRSDIMSDLKIVPGLAVMLAANAVSTETVN